ncbi:nuclear transport factor 2 family protein [Streptomyces canus]|uniref:nuclear transport factor 2 family protein n=1 Tax=Streptomyces canus TaxID=58343 RepID=UPI0033C24B47
MEDDNAVHAVVEAYVAGVSANDAAAVSSVFRKDAFMWGFLGGSDVVAMPASDFLPVVASAPEPARWVDGYDHRIRSVEITGDTAIAVLEESGYLGADFTNYFTLVREDGRWSIASKTFFLTGGSLPAPPEA